MLRKTDHLGLSRRVIAYYLVFSWAAIIWLVVGLVLITRSVLQCQAESTCLVRAGEAARAVRSLERPSADRLQGLVKDFAARWRLSYCGVVSGDGVFLAHSAPEQVGRRYVRPLGLSADWGNVRRVQYTDAAGREVSEYSVPVRKHGQSWGAGGRWSLAFPSGVSGASSGQRPSARRWPSGFLWR